MKCMKRIFGKGDLKIGKMILKLGNIIHSIFPSISLVTKRKAWRYS